MNPTASPSPSLREKNILTTVECHRLMGRGDFERCVRAGWIEACAQMPSGGGSRPRFTRAALERCEARIAAGEVPRDPAAAQRRGAR